MDMAHHAATFNTACKEYITNFLSLSSVGCAFRCLKDKVAVLISLDTAHM
jgi:hypothetical protein